MTLRPEAQAAKWEVLDCTQQEAIDRLSQMIAEAVDALPLASARKRVQEKEGDRPRSTDKKTRNAFLSGDRGTGKTTVLESLIDFTSKEFKLSQAESEKRFANLEPHLAKMRRRVIWLDELDVEPIQQPTSFLMAILVRIEAAFWRWNAPGSSSTEEPEDLRAPLFSGALSPGSDALVRFKRLQTEIAVGWDGNVESRKGQLDADSYAVELIREERARLSLGRDLDRVLDDLATEGFIRTEKQSPLFVLPVDDLDLNPRSCLQLLRLFRLFSTPRLFFVVLGDESLVELVANLHVSNDLSRLAANVNNPKQLSVSPDEVAHRAGNVAANAMRKLLPPAQRVHLEAMSLAEAAFFRPLGSQSAEGGEGLALHEIMQCLPLGTGETKPRPSASRAKASETAGQNLFSLPKVANLRDLLLGAAAGIKLEGQKAPLSTRERPSLLDGAFYSGRFLLNAAPRRLADIWFSLNEVMASKDTDPWQGASLIHYFAVKCRRSLMGDPAFGPEQRRTVRYAIDRSDDGEWQLRPLPIRLFSETEPVTEPILECTPDLTTKLQKVEAKLQAVNEPADAASEESPHEEAPRHPELRFTFASAPRWRFEVVTSEGTGSSGPPAANSSAVRSLDAETAAELTILHDLLALRPVEHGFDPLVASFTSAKPWAATQWSYDGREPVVLPWRHPKCDTLWSLDRFRHEWNQALLRRTGQKNARADARHSHEESTVFSLALRWIGWGTAGYRRDFPRDEFKWSDVLRELEALAGEVLRGGADQNVAHWICSVCTMLMPEMGSLSLIKNSREEGFAHDLLRSELVCAVCRKYRFIIQRQRATRLSEFLKKDNEALCRSFYELTPPSAHDVFRTPWPMVYRLAGREMPKPSRRSTGAPKHDVVETVKRARTARAKK
ncbi:MAG TPA: hypothetical protein VGO11_16785 [Chthoniobacteraceae bacterium]|jgi:hypothetical protein|nr:hypothetical protein [Chthoniobacteraceae bacterium]